MLNMLKYIYVFLHNSLATSGGSGERGHTENIMLNIIKNRIKYFFLNASLLPSKCYFKKI